MWLRFLDACKEAKLQFLESEHPLENVWLIPLDSGLPRAARLICLCEQHGTSYKSFLLETAPSECKTAEVSL